jgi:hypothetical protein
MRAGSICAIGVPAGILRPKMKMTLKEWLRLTVHSLLMPCLLLCLQAGCTRHAPIASELKPLQGAWEGVMLGQETNNKVAITFNGSSLHFEWLEGNMRSNWYEATFALPAGTRPQHLRATITGYYPTNDVGARDIGGVVTAILKIEDGTLTLAGIQGKDQQLPKGIEAFEDNSMFRYAFRHVHPHKSDEASKTR